jgi:hypothetical protein
MDAPEALVLVFRVLACTAATPVVAGLRCRPLASLLPADDVLLPLRGVVRPALPLLDLAYLLATTPGEGEVALELTVGGTRVAFLVEASLDLLALPGAPRPLPALLRAAVPHADCWRALPHGDRVLPLLDLAGLLTPAQAAHYGQQAAALLAARGTAR